MYKRIITLHFVLFSFIAFSQVNDDFSDGDFSQNPEWIGDEHKFIVNVNNQLQLYDKEPEEYNEAILATQNYRIDDTQWEFWVRIAFTPSDSNHPRIYLVSDNSDLDSALNGYYLQIGKSGVGNNRLFFYRQDGEDRELLMEGKHIIASESDNILRVKVVRDDKGEWTVSAAKNSDGVFFYQGSFADDTYENTEWVGFYCKYTRTRAQLFYFDDIYVNDIIPDEEKPGVKGLRVIDANVLEVTFTKEVEENHAENVGYYVVDKGIGAPIIASRLDDTPNVVRLIFEDSFEQNVIYNITIKNIRDLSGNIMDEFKDSFINYVAKRFDIVFNELMVNPEPPVDLPPHEFIELYNTNEFSVNVEGWILQDHRGKRELPLATIPAKGYLVLTTENGYEELSQYGNVVAVPGFTSTSVTHGGSELVIYDDSDYLVSSVYYSDEWYKDPAKENGGWTLEKIDPYNFCGGADNWRASDDNRGGTPGETNSIREDNPDLIQPNLVRAGFIDNDTIVLFFNEPMHEYSLIDTANYNIYNEEHDIGNPSSVIPVAPSFQKVKLALREDLQQGIIYNVKAEQTLTDCAGNELDKNNVKVAVPERATFFDVVINEILFNPPEESSQRYIELYNRSIKPVDLKDYRITSKDTIEGHLTTIREISKESYLFFPGEYVVLTTNPEGVKKHYMTTNPEGFVRLETMPAMTNSGGIAIFTNKSNEIIDMVVYSEDMQYPLLTTESGVALERRNYHRPSDSKSNWHSAAENVNFGTPGYKNSQFSHDPDALQHDITVEPEIFSPNHDGYDDVLNIYFKLDESGYTANVTIYDSRGRLIKKLERSILLGTDDVITWDGTTEDNQKANIGIYVIFIELFDPQGNVSRHKKSAVLAGRL